MATTTAKKAPAKKAAAKKPVTRKPATRKTAAKNTAAKKSSTKSFKNSANKVVNIYFGIIGQGMDQAKNRMELARKENDKRVKKLEKRGEKLRAELTDRFDKAELPKVELPELDNVVEDVKAQINKVQDQVEDAVENVKDKLKAA